MELSPLKSRGALQSFWKAYLKKKSGGGGKHCSLDWKGRVQDERKFSNLQDSAGRKNTDKITQL